MKTCLKREKTSSFSGIILNLSVKNFPLSTKRTLFVRDFAQCVCLLGNFAFYVWSA